MKNSLNIKINYVTLQVLLIAIVVIVAIYFIVRNTSHSHNPEDHVHLDNNKDAYVLFYAPQWCHWSQKISPYWDKMVNDNIDNANLCFNFYKVDCDENRDLCRKYNITGYPTIKFIKKNNDQSTLIVTDHEYDDKLSEKMYDFANNNC
tara:strand:- start:6436 stop:6879 length:444 start_codon:yes stop_codon:yes gene_type:complete